MQTSYAVKWREPSGGTYLGRLELAPGGLVLEGRNGSDAAVRRTIDLEELHGLRLDESAEERLNGRPTLVLERVGGALLVTSALVHAGVLQELMHRLSELGV
jgi:hypothetical protein